MRMNRKPNGKFLALLAALVALGTYVIALLAALVGALISLGAPVTQAGFQWVPPTSQAPVAESFAPPGEPVTVPPVEQTFLPVPGEEPVPAAPQLKPADTAPAVSPVNKQPLPPTAATQPVMAAPAAPAPQPAYGQNVMKVKTLIPPENTDSAPLPIVSPPPSPPGQPPVVVSLPPPVTQTKVIMPEDAPQAAMDNTPNSEKFVINPHPTMPQGPAEQEPAKTGKADMAVIEGFGSDMPLALALQQIIPAGYAASFEPSINPGQAVSWNGGKPWNQVIDEMLAPLQLEAVIRDKMVHIRPQGGGTMRQSEATPITTEPAGLRRANIHDPGEEPQIQAMNLLASTETASGTAAVPPTPADKIAVTDESPAPASGPETPATKTAMPTPEQLSAAPAAPAAGSPQQLAMAEPQQSTDPAPAAAPQMLLPPENNVWEAKTGESLKDILTRWSEKAGVELIWMASYDYKVKKDIALQEKFSAAVETMLKTGLDDTDAAPDIQFVQKPGASAPDGVLIRDKKT